MDTKNTHLSEVLHTEHITPPADGSSHVNVSSIERIVSVVGGSLLTLYGIRKPGPAGVAMAVAGSALLFRGATGYCPMNEAIGRDTAADDDTIIEITRSVTIGKPRQELYQFWRQLENLPKFMPHLEDVRQLGPKRSHWVARLPKGIGKIEWDADIIREEENILIAWQSQPDADINNAGEVRFSDAPANLGTRVQATISYRAPAGAVGAGVARFLNPAFKLMVEDDLRRFKRLMETGEIATIEGQPSGRENEI